MLFFLKKKLGSTSFSDGFHLEEKPLSKRKWFPLARKFVSTSRNKGFFVEKYFRARREQKIITGKNI